MRKNMQKGITLIALVVTIIVLLILAGITINLTIGQNGIMNIAQKAGENYINAADNERYQLAELSNTMDNMLNIDSNEIINNPDNINQNENTVGENAFDNSDDTYDIIQNSIKRLYIPEERIGEEILIKLQTRYGRVENSTSIYFYDINGQQIEGIGTYFYKLGGTTTTDVYTYTIPQNCSYIEFWAGDGEYNPYIYIYSIQFSLYVDINTDLQNALVKDNTVEPGYYNIELLPSKYTQKIMYKKDENEWTEYGGIFKNYETGILYAKGIDNEGKESIKINSVTFQPIITKEACDNDVNTYCKINTAETAKLLIDSSVYQKNISIKLQTRYGRNENSTSIYFYDINGQQIEGIGTYFYKSGGTTTTDVYTYTIPQNCSYIEFWVGDGSYEPYMYIYDISIE